MPLFGSKRDALFLKRINRELIHKVISIEVAVYKLSLADTEMNLYAESNQKVYYNPILLFCLVNKDATASIDTSDSGIDVTQTVQFKFIKADLIDLGLKLDVGDIIKFDEKYYEIDNINMQQYWVGRNDETLPVITQGRSNRDYGYSVSVIAEAHLTRLTQLNLIETRTGIPKQNIPKNL